MLSSLPASRAPALLPCLAGAQAWPSKPIRYIVPFAPGGTTDILGRMVATGLQSALGQPVVVENKPGQAGSIGAAELARAAPDGYTVGGGTISSHAINASLYSKLPYDPLKDFAPITMLATLPNMLVVHPSVNVDNVQRLGRAAQGEPEQVQLRLRQQRHLAAHLGRDVQDHHRHADAAHPLQGQRTDDPGPARRHHPAVLREHHHRLPAGEGRQAQGAGGDLVEALVHGHRGADDGGGRPGWLRHQLLAGDVRARRHAARDRAAPARRDGEDPAAPENPQKLADLGLDAGGGPPRSSPRSCAPTSRASARWCASPARRSTDRRPRFLPARLSPPPGLGGSCRAPSSRWRPCRRRRRRSPA